MSQTVDLNAIRRLVLSNQAQDENLPARQVDKVFADQNGDIRLGSQVAPGEARQLSEIHQGVFHREPTSA